jgi:hypothetical protein
VTADDNPKHPFTMKIAYTAKGEYIGDSRRAHRLYTKWGIVPELASKEHKVCSIGFSKKKQQWYGWSHRAICAFGVGDRIFELRYGDENAPFIKHGKKTIKNMKDAKLATKRFSSVHDDQGGHEPLCCKAGH